ncbi:MAG: hydantoinase/oxoprolinase family protein [Gammaproteobacteria bacterium]|nr:hydantoinase/oxoprolinase family protein [Gammaproteobacteria bacterium]
MPKKFLLGIDTGGTFTDFVLWHDGQIRIHKVLSTPQAPEQAILQGVTDLGLHDIGADARFFIVHGSTVATNAVLEGKGVRTAFITNRGLRDLLTIGRQTRKELYNLEPAPVPPPIPREYCLETGGRLSAQGEVIEALSELDLATLREQITQLAPAAVAINLLFSYLDDRFEKDIAAAMPANVFVSRSSEILPEYKEYERGMTTWLNSYVGPLVQGYLQRLCEGVAGAQVSVMQSSGGTIAAAQAGRHAVRMLLSGPAGGLAAARFVGQLAGRDRLLTFDMGGTSTDVALIEGELQLTNEGRIGDYPVAVPMVDMHTIGAGGGSIASVDAGGLLQVGPQSAGADPGPACYGKGGTQATVTDANLVLGRLRADAFLGGGMRLDETAAQRAVSEVAASLGLDMHAAALGIVQLANEHMAQALRVMSVQRGIDPRELTLVSFGGAGGLHVCALADALEMRAALVPVHAGVLSALGMLVAPRSRQLSQTVNQLLQDCHADTLDAMYAPLIAQGQEDLMHEGVAQDSIEIVRSVDVRYQGQSYYLNVVWHDVEQTARAFHELHEQRYGHALQTPLEIVNLRVALFSEADKPSLSADHAAAAAKTQTIRLHGIEEAAQLYSRADLNEGITITGPALITETISTTYLARGWQATKDRFGNLLLTRKKQ